MIRLVFAVLLGSPVPGTHVLVTLPQVPLPHWAQGVRLGGRVTAEGLVFALRDGMKLAALLVCVGAANSLANPARLLKSLPGALYEAGVAVVVAMTFAPHLVADVARLRAARRLRGRGDRGVRALLQVGLPVLEGALERSVALAAAMDARGYGRTAHVPPPVRRATAALTLGGLLGMCAGTYALLSASGAGYGLPVLLIGLAAAMAGLRLGGRRSVRTRYRPDRWGPRAWLVSGSGVAAAGLMIAAASYAPGALDPPAVPPDPAEPAAVAGAVRPDGAAAGVRGAVASGAERVGEAGAVRVGVRVRVSGGPGRAGAVRDRAGGRARIGDGGGGGPGGRAEPARTAGPARAGGPGPAAGPPAGTTPSPGTAPAPGTDPVREPPREGRPAMIRFDDVAVTYDGAGEPAIRGIDLTVPEGELCLLVGPSGVGKSTLLGAVSGLVPHFTGGALTGRVTVAGRDTRTHRPRELADVVGTVGQDPLAHFVTDTVEDELAYGMESLGVPPETMRRRVEETLDLLGLADLRDRPIATLSGGQQQRVAIGSVLTVHPQVLVLDEPTSALDPGAAEEVLAVLQRLVHDLGTTVLMAEHRLERVVQYADQVILLPGPGRPGDRRDAGRRDGRLARPPARRRAGPARRLVAAAAVGTRRAPPGRGAARAAGGTRTRWPRRRARRRTPRTLRAVGGAPRALPRCCAAST